MTTIGKLSKFNILQLFQKQNNIKNLLNELKKKKNHIKYSYQIVHL